MVLINCNVWLYKDKLMTNELTIQYQFKLS